MDRNRLDVPLDTKRGDIARAAVHRAVKRGDLEPVRVKQCVCCGNDAVHYHHHSYGEYYEIDVIPMCGQCHRILHTRGQRGLALHLNKRLCDLVRKVGKPEHGGVREPYKPNWDHFDDDWDFRRDFRIPKVKMLIIGAFDDNS